MTPPLPAVGTRACVTVNSKEYEGTVLFAGRAEFKSGNWVGLALDAPVGKNDGSVLGVRYFSCDPSHGLFVSPKALRVLGGDAEADEKDDRRMHHEYGDKLRPPPGRLPASRRSSSTSAGSAKSKRSSLSKSAESVDADSPRSPKSAASSVSPKSRARRRSSSKPVDELRSNSRTRLAQRHLQEDYRPADSFEPMSHLEPAEEQFEIRVISAISGVGAQQQRYSVEEDDTSHQDGAKMTRKLESLEQALHASREEVAALKEERIQSQTAHSREMHALEAMLQQVLMENSRLKKLANAAADDACSVRSVSEPATEP